MAHEKSPKIRTSVFSVNRNLKAPANYRLARHDHNAGGPQAK